MLQRFLFHTGGLIPFGQGVRPEAPTVFSKVRLPHFALARGWSVTEVIPTRRDNDNLKIILFLDSFILYML